MSANFNLFCIIILCNFLIVLCEAQMVPQCLCNAVEKCKAGLPENIMPCVDSCQVNI